MAGRPIGAQNKDKPYRDALRRAIARSSENPNDPHTLDRIAERHLATCMAGDMSAIRELADRLDGKVPQGIGQAPELDKLEITWKSNKSSSITNRENNSSPSIIDPNASLVSWPTDGQEKQ
jgi:hypothetical protein